MTPEQREKLREHAEAMRQMHTTGFVSRPVILSPDEVLSLLAALDEATRERDDWKRQWESACDDIAIVQECAERAEAALAAAHTALREHVRLLDEKYVRVANEVRRAVDDGDFGDYVEFEEGRREAFKWAAEKAREMLAVLAAGGGTRPEQGLGERGKRARAEDGQGLETAE